MPYPFLHPLTLRGKQEKTGHYMMKKCTKKTDQTP